MTHIKSSLKHIKSSLKHIKSSMPHIKNNLKMRLITHINRLIDTHPTWNLKIIKKILLGLIKHINELNS